MSADSIIDPSVDPMADANRVQRLAADPEASVWVAASAGTGKTKALTDRVLSLLLVGTAPSRILCLTFTRAAAANMANRVNERLAAWARADDETLVEELTALTGKAPDTRRMTLARRLFADVLDAPGGLRIATIHAFCESVLKRFPVEAGLAPHFEVVDERAANELLQQARDEVLAQARSAENGDGRLAQLASALTRVAERINEAQLADLMAALAREHGRLAALLERTGGLDGLLAAVARGLNLKPGENEASVLSAACADSAFDRVGLTHVCAALAKGSAADQKKGIDVAQFLEASVTDRAKNLDDYRSVFLTKPGEIRATLATKAVIAALGVRAEVLTKEAERLVALAGRLKAVRLLEGTASVLTIGEALLAAYVRLKDARAALDYDDLILKMRALVSSPSAVQWVLFKLDRGLDHILVDEAQDTSSDQWAMVAALAEEFFTGEGAHSGVRTVFAVGDAKQSIYSFQRADPEAFAAMRAHFEERAKAVRMTWRDLGLDVSFRSVAPVLDAVDAVFAKPEAADGVAEEGKIVTHRSARLGEAGLVEVWPAVEAPETASAPSWQPPVEAAAVSSPSARLAAQIADTISRWLSSKEILASQGRPIRPGDVMILVRQRTGFMDQLVRALKERDVPVAGVDRMVLTDQLVVQDLMALARFVLLPDDNLTLAALLKGPLIGLDEDQLFAVAYGRPKGGSLWSALKARAEAEPSGPFADAERTLSAWLARADFVRPFELFARVLHAEGGRARLLARLGMEADDPLSEFLALALAYEREAVPSLQGFIAWVEAGQAQIKRDLDSPVRDEVRVMTVHGAKGLQAPIVFLPDTMKVPGNDSPLTWIEASGEDRGNQSFLRLPLWVPRVVDADPVASRERAARQVRGTREYHRLLYVAMTRAEDRLYVGGFKSRKTAGGNWYDLVGAGLTEIAEKKTFSAGQGFEGTKLVLASEQNKPLKDKDRNRKPEFVIDDGTLPDWIRVPAAPETAVVRPLTPSRFALDESSGDVEPAPISPLAAGGDRFRRGIAVHRMLQLLPELPAARRGPRARALAVELGFADADAEKLTQEVLGVLAHPGLASLFAPGSLSEVPFAGRLGDGGAEIVGRLDRLAVTDKEVIVADYKTNRPVPRDGGAVAPIYLRQMALYRAALAHAFPGRNVRAILVYTDGPKVIELSTDVLDEIISRVSASRAPHGSVA